MRTPNPQPPFFARFSGPHSSPFGRCRLLNLERPPHRPLWRPPESVKGLPARPLFLAAGDWLPGAELQPPASCLLAFRSPCFQFAGGPARPPLSCSDWLAASSPLAFFAPLPRARARLPSEEGVSSSRAPPSRPIRIPIGSGARPSASPSPPLAPSISGSAYDVWSDLPRAHPTLSASDWWPGPLCALRPSYLLSPVPSASPPPFPCGQPPSPGRTAPAPRPSDWRPPRRAGSGPCAGSGRAGPAGWGPRPPSGSPQSGPRTEGSHPSLTAPWMRPRKALSGVQTRPAGG